MTRIALVLQTVVLVALVALVAAVGVAKLARLDGATYPIALMRGATAFAAVLTLVATLTAALVQVLA